MSLSGQQTTKSNRFVCGPKSAIPKHRTSEVRQKTCRQRHVLFGAQGSQFGTMVTACKLTKTLLLLRKCPANPKKVCGARRHLEGCARIDVELRGNLGLVFWAPSGFLSSAPCFLAGVRHHLRCKLTLMAATDQRNIAGDPALGYCNHKERRGQGVSSAIKDKLRNIA